MVKAHFQLKKLQKVSKINVFWTRLTTTVTHLDFRRGRGDLLDLERDLDRLLLGGDRGRDRFSFDRDRLLRLLRLSFDLDLDLERDLERDFDLLLDLELDALLLRALAGGEALVFPLASPSSSDEELDRLDDRDRACQGKRALFYGDKPHKKC